MPSLNAHGCWQPLSRVIADNAHYVSSSDEVSHGARTVDPLDLPHQGADPDIAALNSRHWCCDLMVFIGNRDCILPSPGNAVSCWVMKAS